jgi:hypothetical protein
MSANEHLEHLVNRCGDRRTGTRGNALAAHYIVSTLEEAGFACRAEAFPSPHGIQAALEESASSRKA